MYRVTKEKIEKAVKEWRDRHNVKRDFVLTYVYTTTFSEEPTSFAFDEEEYVCAEVVFKGINGRAVWFDLGNVNEVFTAYRDFHSVNEPTNRELRAE